MTFKIFFLISAVFKNPSAVRGFFSGEGYVSTSKFANYFAQGHFSKIIPYVFTLVGNESSFRKQWFEVKYFTEYLNGNAAKE